MQKCQIIIPMSGFGERFRACGYETPKPLIEIDGKPIIEHVVSMFDKSCSFIFICNKDHLNCKDYKMREILNKIAPGSNIVAVDPHKKGPVHAILQSEYLIDKNSEVLISYCDYFCLWDFNHFLKKCRYLNLDGAIPAYKGFHPHSLGNTNYAYLKMNNDCKYLVTDISEKKPWTENKMQEYASSGAYWFKTGKLMLDAMKYQVENDIHINDEFYVSLSYKYLFNNKFSVGCYPLKHFMQWGTPEDVEEYNQWSNTFKKLVSYNSRWNKPLDEKKSGTLVIPMAGLGERFSNAGYNDPKPLIKASGIAMVIQALDSMPNYEHAVAILRNDMGGVLPLAEALKNRGIFCHFIDYKTKGQADSVMIALNALKEKIEISGPIYIASCDGVFVFNHTDASKLAQKNDIVSIVTQPIFINQKTPYSYGWVYSNEDKIDFYVKTPPPDFMNSFVFSGNFIFKNYDSFKKLYNYAVDNKIFINNELYIDSFMQIAKNNSLNFDYIPSSLGLSFGTPNELKTFEYWQSAFHFWKKHPYKIWNDFSVFESNKVDLVLRYEKWNFDDIFN